MYPILYEKSKTITELTEILANKRNGIAVLKDCSDCIVQEERNGAYTLEFRYPLSANHYKDIEVGCCVLAKPNPVSENQFFRIYKITKPFNDLITVYANHISYDLNKTSVLPFTSTGAVVTMNELKTHMVVDNGFTFTTDIANTSSTFTVSYPQTARQLLGGQDGSLLDVFGGEYEWDNANIKLLANRGSNRGFRIAYGKNLTDLQQEENIENVYTAVLPYAIDSTDNVIVGDLLEVITQAEPRIMNLDLSSYFTSDDGSEVVITVDDVNAKAKEYVENNDITTPKVNIEVSFVDLSKTEEYKDIAPLLQINLCDEVTVYFEKLGINATAKMIAYEYDVILERYNDIEIGDAKSTLSDTIIDVGEQAVNKSAEATGFLSSTINMFTSVIANGLGLYTTRVPSGEAGAYQIYLHNKKTLALSQYQWTINASGFAVSQDYGQTWSAGFDTEGNAVFNSLSANIIRALSIYGSTIVFGNEDGAHITAQSTSNNDGVWFDGTGRIQFNSVGAISLINEKDNGTIANLIQINQTNNQNMLNLNNNDITGKSGNSFSSYTYSNALYSIGMYNYSPVDNSLANTIISNARTTDNTWWITNYFDSIIRNQITLSAKSIANLFTVTNYYVGSESEETNILANRLEIASYNATSSVTLNNYFDGYRRNSFSQTATSTWASTNISNTVNNGNTANAMEFSRRDDMNLYSVWNYNTSNVIRNYLQLRSQDNGNADLFLVNNDASGNMRSQLYMSANGTFQLFSNTGGNSYVGTTTTGNLTIQANNSLNLISQNYRVVIQTAGVSHECQWVTIGNYTYLVAI